jgi:hypothetical protein
MNGPTNKPDYWYLSLVPIVVAIGLYLAHQNGSTIGTTDITLPVLPNITLPNLSLTVNMPGGFQPSGTMMGMVAGSVALGVLLCTWLVMLLADGKRGAQNLLTGRKQQRRGAVSGMLRPEPTKVEWSSKNLATEEASAYRSRMSAWIRQQIDSDRTSGVLRID